MYYSKKEDTTVTQQDGSQKHVLSKRGHTQNTYCVIPFILSSRRCKQNKMTFIVLEVKIEFNSVLETY